MNKTTQVCRYLILLWNMEISTILALHGPRSSAGPERNFLSDGDSVCKEGPNT